MRHSGIQVTQDAALAGSDCSSCPGEQPQRQGRRETTLAAVLLGGLYTSSGGQVEMRQLGSQSADRLAPLYHLKRFSYSVMKLTLVHPIDKRNKH
ncbi:hypothetical protein NDU88_000991 [Pleurodeles waltl]|uniref:Uncharacterized protein n=1 Tax=Pleurodeles waltl TaxID=8319 RepID=A0AAV7LEM0_PLEWA|nr:hypothetical protein NDU88_000991 [Pleurodeles waltl]